MSRPRSGYYAKNGMTGQQYHPHHCLVLSEVASAAKFTSTFWLTEVQLYVVTRGTERVREGQCPVHLAPSESVFNLDQTTVSHEKIAKYIRDRSHWHRNYIPYSGFDGRALQGGQGYLPWALQERAGARRFKSPFWVSVEDLQRLFYDRVKVRGVEEGGGVPLERPREGTSSLPAVLLFNADQTTDGFLIESPFRDGAALCGRTGLPLPPTVQERLQRLALLRHYPPPHYWFQGKGLEGGTEVVLDGVVTILYHAHQGFHKGPAVPPPPPLCLPREYVARSGQSGRPYPRQKIEYLREVAERKGYQSEYWITEAQFSYFLPACELKSQSEVGVPLPVKDKSKDIVTYYNSEQMSDPEAVLRNLCVMDGPSEACALDSRTTCFRSLCSEEELQAIRRVMQQIPITSLSSLPNKEEAHDVVRKWGRLFNVTEQCERVEAVSQKMKERFMQEASVVKSSHPWASEDMQCDVDPPVI